MKRLVNVKRRADGYNFKFKLQVEGQTVACFILLKLSTIVSNLGESASSIAWAFISRRCARIWSKGKPGSLSNGKNLGALFGHHVMADRGQSRPCIFFRVNASIFSASVSSGGRAFVECRIWGGPDARGRPHLCSELPRRTLMVTGFVLLAAHAFVYSLVSSLPATDSDDLLFKSLSTELRLCCEAIGMRSGCKRGAVTHDVF